MTNHRVFTFPIVIAALTAMATAVACSDAPEGNLCRGNCPGSSGSNGGGGTGGDGGDGSEPPEEEKLFRALQAELEQKCGGQCHTDATYVPLPPAFLAPPDPYLSIKAQPGVVVGDYYQSSLLTKGPHAGPAIGVDPTFEAKVVEWLKMEAMIIQSIQKPTTPPFTVVNGPNDVDLTPAAVGGLTGVRLKFNASLVGGILSLDQMTIVAAAGSDVHILKPRFIRILTTADASGRTEIPDPADTFSNTDQTVPNAAETLLLPGSALFPGDGWVPFDLANDRIRIEIEKLEPGKVAIIEQPKTCRDPAGFAANSLPGIRTQAAGGNTCAGCHGNGLAGLNLNSGDNALVCNQILQKLNEGNLAQSLFVTKVTAGPHSGGTVPNAGAWTTLITTAYDTYMKQ